MSRAILRVVVLMLSITSKQKDAFRAKSLTDTETWIANHLRSHHRSAVEALDEPALRKHVRAGMLRTQRHGINDPNDVLAYVVLMFEVAPDFDQRPRIRAVLDWTSRMFKGRMSALMKHTEPEDWLAARTECHPDAWRFLVGKVQ